MAARRLSRISVGLVLLGVGISVAWIYFAGGPRSLSALRRIDPLFLAPLVGITAVHLALRFVRWQFLLRRADVRIPARPSLSIYLASLAGSATPAYVGEVIRCAFARRRFGAPVKVTLAVLVLERLLDVAALGAIAVVTSRTPREAAVFAAILLVVAAVVGVAVSQARRSAFPIAMLRALRAPGALGPAFLLSLAIWSVAALSVALAADAMGETVGFAQGSRIFSHATLFGGVTLMPAGLGATGSAAVERLVDLGMETRSALPIVVLFRLTTTGAAIAIGLVFLVLELRRSRSAEPEGAPAHFDEIAAHYQHEYAPHVWKLLLDRKVTMLASPLPKPPSTAGRGLDLGCGLGHQCLAMRERGFQVFGIDPSLGLLRRAREGGAPVAAADALRLPFADGTFDFVYTVGVLHHLPDAVAQAAAVAEARRVLKPGGLLLVHETNTRNPLFRFYMGYVFPILKTIDEGTEHWIEPFRWESTPGFALQELRYFTFLPDTIPRPLLPALLALEHRLERSVLRPYAVHYMAVVRKTATEERP